jgi:hypothetical protein
MAAQGAVANLPQCCFVRKQPRPLLADVISTENSLIEPKLPVPNRPVPNRIPSSEFRVELFGYRLGSFQAGFLGIPHEFFSSSEDIQGGGPDGRGDARCRRARRRGIGPGCLPTEVGWARGGCRGAASTCPFIFFLPARHANDF